MGSHASLVGTTPRPSPSRSSPPYSPPSSSSHNRRHQHLPFTQSNLHPLHPPTATAPCPPPSNPTNSSSNSRPPHHPHPLPISAPLIRLVMWAVLTGSYAMWTTSWPSTTPISPPYAWSPTFCPASLPSVASTQLCSAWPPPIPAHLSPTWTYDYAPHPTMTSALTTHLRDERTQPSTMSDSCRLGLVTSQFHRLHRIILELSWTTSVRQWPGFWPACYSRLHPPPPPETAAACKIPIAHLQHSLPPPHPSPPAKLHQDPPPCHGSSGRHPATAAAAL